MRIAILGAGAWGTALGIALAPRHAITLWCRDPQQGGQLAATRVNARYLPDIVIPDTVQIAADADAVLQSCELVIVAVPTAALRETVCRVAQQKRALDVVWLCKGFESGSAKFPHQVAGEELGERFRAECCPGRASPMKLRAGCRPRSRWLRTMPTLRPPPRANCIPGACASTPATILPASRSAVR